MQMRLHTKGKSTNLFACNGEIHIGDHVIYDDGVIAFKVQIVEENGVCGFVYENTFHPLLDFVQDMSLDKVKSDAGRDFTIVN